MNRDLLSLSRKKLALWIIFISVSLFACIPTSAHADTRTIANGGGNWTANGTWVEGAAPTAADDVVATGTSGNVTIDAGAVARSVNLTSYVGTLTHTAGVTLTIGDATAGASSVALKLVSGMTYTLGSVTTSAISFISTSTTQQTVDYGGKNAGNITFNASSNGNWAMTSGITTDATATVTLTKGALHTDGTSDSSALTHSWGFFNTNNSNTRSLTLGASNITLTGASTSVWAANISGGFTLNSGT